MIPYGCLPSLFSLLTLMRKRKGERERGVRSEESTSSEGFREHRELRRPTVHKCLAHLFFLMRKETALRTVQVLVLQEGGAPDTSPPPKTVLMQPYTLHFPPNSKASPGKRELGARGAGLGPDTDCRAGPT